MAVIITAVILFKNGGAAMQFTGRKNELAALERARIGAKKGPARMTIVSGRRRVGKTTLILESVKNTPYVYWFISHATEKDLADMLTSSAASSLGDVVPRGLSFTNLFLWVMQFSEKHPLTLIIDEFQNLADVNSALFSIIQGIWDRKKDSSHLHLVLSGSSYSMMKRIFENRNEPLFGRATTKLHVHPFFADELISLVRETNLRFGNDDLLALYTITGGVPLYVADFIDNGICKKDAMFRWVARDGSLYLTEGIDLLRLEIGQGQSTYFSILRSLARGFTQSSRIADLIGVNVISSYLERLENYGFIEKSRPVFSKPNTRAIRWKIHDPFLRFWFRFIEGRDDYFSYGQSDSLLKNITENYETFSGVALEQFFREKLMRTGKYRSIGSWWNQKRGAEGAQNEIDIVATSNSEKTLLLAEVKRQKKAFKEKQFLDKVAHFKTLLPANLRIETTCLALEDIGLKK